MSLDGIGFRKHKSPIGDLHRRNLYGNLHSSHVPYRLVLSSAAQSYLRFVLNDSQDSLSTPSRLNFDSKIALAMGYVPLLGCRVMLALMTLTLTLTLALTLNQRLDSTPTFTTAQQHSE